MILIWLRKLRRKLVLRKKELIKKVLRKAYIWEYDNNVSRNEYNDLLREAYEGREAFFDLAKIESTYPGGKRSTFNRKGGTFPSLIPQYTPDAGHLNQMGRKIVAEQLLILLANLFQ